MSLTIPTQLVKISVIENLTPVSFLHTVIAFYLDQFIVLKGMLINRTTRKTRISQNSR